MHKLLLTILLSSLFSLLSPSPTLAACPGAINNSDLTVVNGNTCTVPAGTTYYLDKTPTEGTNTNDSALTLTGGSITIANTGVLKVGRLIPNGGSIIIQNGGSISVGQAALWVADADADGYAASFTTYTATAAGRRRLGLMKSTTNDCNDTGTNAGNVYVSATCYVDSDNDDYGSTTSKTCTNNATCGSATWASGAAGTAAASGTFAANNTDCHDTGTNAALVWSSTTCYIDIDNDNYTNGSKTCTNNATCASATNGSTGDNTTVVTYSAGNLQATTGAGNTDCYDADAATTNAELAYPTSATCSTAHRGDGSYDYNCVGGGVACGSTYYNTVYTCVERGNLQAGCPCQTYNTTTTSAASCGGAGYVRGGLMELDNTCGYQTWWTIGASGTQACQ